MGRIAESLTSVLLIVALMSALLSVTAAAASEHKWTKVTPEEWALQPPAEYPHAPAVTLFDMGKMTMRLKGAKLERHVRHKIFNKQGASAAINVQISVVSGTHFGDFNAVTIQPSGKKTFFSVFDLMRKKVGTYLEVISFSFPDVTDGCIVELKYDLSADGGFGGISDWQFQGPYFTYESVLSFAASDYLDFTPSMIRIPDSLQTPTRTEEKIDDRRTTRFTWKMSDIPPVADEPYRGAVMSYQPAIYFEWTGYKPWWSDRQVKIMSGWADMGEAAVRLFEAVLDSVSLVKPLADSLLAGLGVNAEAQLRALHAYVRDSVVVSGGEDDVFWPTQLLSETHRKRTGSATDRNLYLIALLRAARFGANPVIAARRDHARLNTSILTWRQFNYLICRVAIGSTVYVLDANSGEFRFPHINPQVRSHGGLMAGLSSWDTVWFVYPGWESGIKVESRVWMKRDGSAVCTTHASVKGYYQKGYDLFDDEKEVTQGAVQEVLAALSHKSLEIVDAQRTPSSDGDSISVDLILKISDYGAVAGDRISCAPSLLWSDTPPFVSQLRQFPVDFRYPFSRAEIVEIYLDSGLVLAAPPKNGDAKEAGMAFSQSVLSAASSVRVMSQMYAKQVFFEPEEYDKLREFFQSITTFTHEPLMVTVK